jgi:hypothetical protein
MARVENGLGEWKVGEAGRGAVREVRGLQNNVKRAKGVHEETYSYGKLSGQVDRPGKSRKEKG